MVQNLLNGKKYEVHGSWLKFFQDSSLNVSDELVEHVANQGIVLGVDAIVGHRINSETAKKELLVSWTGLEAIENSWEPLEVMLHDVPTKVQQYAAASDDASLLRCEGTRTKNGKVIECVVDALRHKQAMKKAGDEVSEVAERAVCGPTALREKMREDDATRESVCVYACAGAAEVLQAQVRVVKAMASMAEQRRDSRMKLQGAQGDHEQVGSEDSVLVGPVKLSEFN
ncbi:hypothetical protein PR001_g144 [Phytophthora rubi]|uniref:Chromo domain-containing protein n=1 Tax=Phytophthora rubi TaxID=129364 RepID=A0A6A3PAX7_9STRA|nr:hypothetical protein PR001_g144 [Phytophthora rubi]